MGGSRPVAGREQGGNKGATSGHRRGLNILAAGLPANTPDVAGSAQNKHKEVFGEIHIRMNADVEMPN